MLNSKAYSEVFYIINEMSDELKSKIPNEVIQNIKNKMDKNYEFYLEDDNEDIELLEDTEKILSVLYTDYLATEEEKNIIKNKEKLLRQKNRNKLSDIKIKDLFEDKQKNQKENNNELIQVTQGKWYTKILTFIKKFYHKIRR